MSAPFQPSQPSQSAATHWSFTPFGPHSPGSIRSRLTWIVALLIAILLHWAALQSPWVKILAPQKPAPAPPVAIDPIDPSKLEAIRKKWKENDKSLLLQKDRDRPKEKTPPPPDARYYSDRNMRVDKEQRARNTDVLPHPPQGKPAEPKQRPRAPAKPPLPALGSLGVPLPQSGPKNDPPKPRAPDPAQAQPGEQAPGADQALLEDRLPEGTENLLNAQESVYYSYFARMSETIGPMWRSRVSDVTPRLRMQPGDYTTIVDVMMDRDGAIVDVLLLQSSGIKEFDEIVKSTWAAAKRFPNPPQGIIKGDGHAHTSWSFTVRMSPGSGLLYAPPERTS